MDGKKVHRPRITRHSTTMETIYDSKTKYLRPVLPRDLSGGTLRYALLRGGNRR